MPGRYGKPGRPGRGSNTRKRTKTRTGRSSAEARKARTARNQRMRTQGSTTRTRTTGQKRPTPPKAAKKAAKAEEGHSYPRRSGRRQGRQRPGCVCSLCRYDARSAAARHADGTWRASASDPLMSVSASPISDHLRDVCERALYTAAEAFLAVFVITDLSTAESALSAAGAAFLSVVKTFVVERKRALS